MELVYVGHVMDEYRMTLTLDNRINAAVTLRTVDLIRIASVRADGSEMWAGSMSLANTYEVLPGKSTIVLEGTGAPTTYHGFGSPVTAFKLSGQVNVTNSYPDQLSRMKYCNYQDMDMGAPFTGYWGS